MDACKNVIVDKAEIAGQYRFIELIRALNEQYRSLTGRRKTACVHSYGCQQNAVDGEKLAGMLQQAGFAATDDPKAADVTVFNTCAVRENAEERVYGNTGALRASKRANPDKIICLCGCMVQQQSVAEKIKKSYPYVDIVLGTHALHRFPQLLYGLMTGSGRIFENPDGDGVIAEGLPTLRQSAITAGVPISYGCNNFCTYCIVPHVRGRERSRDAAEVIGEVGGLVKSGYKEITLLGQNVNSYGNDRADCPKFSKLLGDCCGFDGDYRLRFMTSHPKDAGEELFEAIAANSKAARHLHLPVQSGSDAILARMNRHYDSAAYLKKIEAARRICPGLCVTADVMVGFPGESEADFADTLALVDTVRYDMLFMFIYSRRGGTPAADYPDQIPEEVKSERFSRLLALQESISEQKHKQALGATERVLVDGFDEKHGAYSGKNDGVLRVLFNSQRDLTGQFVNVKITQTGRHWVSGELI